MTWREQLRAWLDEHDRTQQWLADQIGTSKAAVGHWITGERGISAPHAKRLSTMIGIPLSEILEMPDATLLTDEEAALLDYWRGLSADERETLLRLLNVTPRTESE